MCPVSDIIEVHQPARVCVTVTLIIASVEAMQLQRSRKADTMTIEEHSPAKLEFVSGALLEKSRARTTASYECELGNQRFAVNILRKEIERGALLLGRNKEIIKEQKVLIQHQELLAKEADHRLMNDLQLVASLLSLQSRATANVEAASQLTIAANRIATIQRVHRRLHCLDGVQNVAFKQYLEAFCDDFAAMLPPSSAPGAAIEFESVELDLPTKTAIPLGFIVNELVMNAVKHGNGRIWIKLVKKTAESSALSVSNDGPALPQGFDPSTTKGLGMKIVRSFVQQIGGQSLIGRNEEGQGAKFTVLFP